MQRVQLPYPGGKGRLAPRIVSFLPRRGRTYVEPFVGRGNIFWEAVQRELKFERWWLNDLQTHTFLQAIKSHGNKVEVPVRSRRVFEYLREAYKRGDVMATLLAPHICYSGGLYESGVKGGSGCGDDDGGGSAAGFQRTLIECHRILNETNPKITGLDWARLGLEKLKGDDVVVLDPPYAFPLNIVKAYSDDTVDYEQLVDLLLTAKFRWLLCGYPHPILHRLGAPIWARDMQLLCVRVKPGGEERSECIWTNFDPESERSQRFLPASVKGQIKVISDAASLSFTALDERIDSGIEQLAKDFTALVPFLLEMHRRLSAPGKRTDLRRGAPNALTWTAWVTSKRHKLGRGLRSIQYLLKGRTDASQHRLMLANARKNFANRIRCEPDSSIPVNKVHCGDCVKLMEKMTAGSVDLIVTSPPYNLLNSTGNGMKDGFGGKWEAAALSDGYDLHDDGMPHQEYVRWQRECLTSMMRLLPEHGAIFYNHKWRVQDGLLQDRSDIVKGFPVRQIIVAPGWGLELQFRILPTELRDCVPDRQARLQTCSTS